jgi:UDP-N-acetylglucosamine 2-epimerase (non-hydrolysing)
MKNIEGNVDIVTIAGNRPEVIKLSQLVKSINDSNNCKHVFLYTGQHYSHNMKDIFFDALDVQPDYDLRCDTSDVSILKDNIAKFLRITKPQLVIVYGDTNTTLAGALAAKDMTNCKLIHIEAGLRSFDMRMPEERNRILVDAISDYLFVPTELAKTFLRYENIENNVYVTGNLIVDVCRKFSLYAEFKDQASLPDKFLLLTLHRAENVDDPAVLHALSKHLSELKFNVVYPIHPRTRSNLIKYNIQLPNNVKVIEPVGYLDFLGLLKKCMLILTDSGGVQEEALILGKPCITLRNSTERQETLLLRANRLFPLLDNDENSSLSSVIEEMLHSRIIDNNPYGEHVTTNILELLSELIIINETGPQEIKGKTIENGASKVILN